MRISIMYNWNNDPKYYHGNNITRFKVCKRCLFFGKIHEYPCNKCKNIKFAKEDHFVPKERSANK